MDYAVQSYRPVDQSTGLRSDPIIVLRGAHSAPRYPAPLRRVRYHDEETDNILAFITNNLTLPALTIAQLYRCRWQIELFFKWIKQNLRIKSFLGHSPNAVKTQLWIAISAYVLLALAKKELQLKRNLSEISEILAIHSFEQVPLPELLTTKTPEIPQRPSHNLLWPT
jgi:Transposase DDE domain